MDLVRNRSEIAGLVADDQGNESSIHLLLPGQKPALRPLRDSALAIGRDNDVGEARWSLEVAIVPWQFVDGDVERTASSDKLAQPVHQTSFIPSPRMQGKKPFSRAAGVRDQGAP